MTRVLCAMVALLVSGAASADVLKGTNANASSAEPEANGVSYEAKNIADGKASSVWCEGVSGSGLGSWVSVDVADGPKPVTALKIWNGHWYSADFWQRHNRAKEIEVEFSDGSVEKFTLKDEQAPEVIRFSKPVTTSSIKVKVKSVYNGNTFNDTVISEIQLQDDVPSTRLAVTAFKASSTYPSDADGNYEAANIDDGLLDTMWCEGNKSGDGTNDWLELTFGGAKPITKMKVRNGNAYSSSLNMKSNRAKTATLTFADGSKETVTLKTNPLEQELTFPAHTSNKVKITFDSIQRGSDPNLNDLCVSELSFYP